MPTALRICVIIRMTFNLLAACSLISEVKADCCDSVNKDSYFINSACRSTKSAFSLFNSSLDAVKLFCASITCKLKLSISAFKFEIILSKSSHVALVDACADSDAKGKQSNKHKQAVALNPRDDLIHKVSPFYPGTISAFLSAFR